MRSPTSTELPHAPPGRIGWPWTEESPQLPDTMPDGSPWPRVSIVTPSFNQGQFIEETIRSVLLQGYPNLEYIVMDGGSTDESVGIIRKYEPWLTFWVSEPDGGQADAINKGFERATGEILGWLNSDDILLPRALAQVVALYSHHPEAVAWVGGCYRIRPGGRILEIVLPRGLKQELLADWSEQGFFFQPSCFFAASAWNELSALDESLDIAFDLEWWLRLAGRGRFAATSATLAAATIHPEAKTQARLLDMWIETAMVQIRYGYPHIAKRWLARRLEQPSVRTRVRQRLYSIAVRVVEAVRFWDASTRPQYLQDVLHHEMMAGTQVEDSHMGARNELD